ncbi:MAG: hypothetical protein ACLFVJ_21810 [Persicimonas sp.]
MGDDENSWSSWRIHVVQTIKEQSKQISEMDEKLTKLLARDEASRVKWGIITAIGAVLLSTVVSLVVTVVV